MAFKTRGNTWEILVVCSVRSKKGVIEPPPSFVNFGSAPRLWVFVCFWPRKAARNDEGLFSESESAKYSDPERGTGLKFRIQIWRKAWFNSRLSNYNSAGLRWSLFWKWKIFYNFAAKIELCLIHFCDFGAAFSSSGSRQCYQVLSAAFPQFPYYLWDSIDWIKNIWQKIDP